jgi:hypothetical protein
MRKTNDAKPKTQARPEPEPRPLPRIGDLAELDLDAALEAGALRWLGPGPCACAMCRAVDAPLAHVCVAVDRKTGVSAWAPVRKIVGDQVNPARVPPGMRQGSDPRMTQVEWVSRTVAVALTPGALAAIAKPPLGRVNVRQGWWAPFPRLAASIAICGLHPYPADFAE